MTEVMQGMQAASRTMHVAKLDAVRVVQGVQGVQGMCAHVRVNIYGT